MDAIHLTLIAHAFSTGSIGGIQGFIGTGTCVLVVSVCQTVLPFVGKVEFSTCHGTSFLPLLI
jgi:hypothetical protein